MRDTSLKYAAAAIKIAAERALKQAQSGPSRPRPRPKWDDIMQLQPPNQPWQQRQPIGRPLPPVNPQIPGLTSEDLQRYFEQRRLEASLREPLGNLRDLAKQTIDARRKDMLDGLVAPPWSPTENPSTEQRLLYELGKEHAQQMALDERKGLKPSPTALPRRKPEPVVAREPTESVDVKLPESSPAPAKTYSSDPKLQAPEPPARLAKRDARPTSEALAISSDQPGSSWAAYLPYLLPLVGAGIGGGAGYAMGDEDEKNDRSTRIRNAILGLLLGGGLGIGGAYLLHRLGYRA